MNFNITTDPIKITVIIPVYNHQGSLKRCLDSVIHQSLEELQIICINDGSTDNSLKIMKDYAKDDSRILVLEQVHQGANVARKAGLHLAFGEYICFLDGNDFLDINLLEQNYTEVLEGSSHHQISYDTKTKSYTTVVEPVDVFDRIIRRIYVENHGILFQSDEQNLISLEKAVNELKKNMTSKEVVDKIAQLDKKIEQIGKGKVPDRSIEKELCNELKKLHTINGTMEEKIDQLLISHNKEQKKIEKQLIWANQEIKNIRSSATYKIGRFFTFIPRMLRKIF